MTKLKFLRLKKAITQQKLEELTGVRRWKIALSENGVLNLNDSDLSMLAKYFGVNPKDLLESVRESA